MWVDCYSSEDTNDSEGGEIMRRATNPTRKFSISIPESTYNLLDKTLSYDQSRSAFIAGAIQDKLSKIDNLVTIHDVRNLSLEARMKWVMNHEDVDASLKAMLLHLLS